MIFLGYFSFWGSSSKSGESNKEHGPCCGYFSCVAEATSVEEAFEKFHALLRRLDHLYQLFTGVKEVHLESCIETKSIPQQGFLAYYYEEKGERQPAITTSLLGVRENQACAYEWVGSDARKGDNWPGQPFMVFDEK